MADLIERAKEAFENHGRLSRAEINLALRKDTYDLARAAVAAGELAEAYKAAQITQTKATGPFIWVIQESAKVKIEQALARFRAIVEGKE